MSFYTRRTHGPSLMDERRLLKILASSTGYVACDGDDRATAHKLEARGWAEWKGESWGSQFYAATEIGREKVRGWERIDVVLGPPAP